MFADEATGRSNRRSQFKATCRADETADRRRRALAEQQNEARANRIDDMRRIAMAALLGSAEGNGNDGDDEEVEIQEEDVEDAEMDIDSGSNHTNKGKKMQRLRKLHRTLFFARQFQMPDWMLDPPADLTINWLVQVKPEGDRCLLLSDGGSVQIRRKNGHILEHYTDTRFPRGLTILDVVCLESLQETQLDKNDKMVVAEDEGTPASGTQEGMDMDVSTGGEGRGGAVRGGGGGGGGGGRGQGAGRGRGCTGRGTVRTGRGYADPGIVTAATEDHTAETAPSLQRHKRVGRRTYAVCDVLMWADQDMMSADAECRMFWLASRFSEFSDGSKRARPLTLVPAKLVTAESLSEAYHGELGYSKDSLLFLHREGCYHSSEAVTPLALLWRDRHITRFVVDTPDQAGKQIPEHQAVVLELRAGNRLRTAERHVVAQLSDEDARDLHQSSYFGKEKEEKIQGGPQEVEIISKAAAGRVGALVRVEADGIDVAQRKVSIAKVSRFVPSRTRVWADSWARIVFQHLHRTGQAQFISFQALVQSALGSASPGGQGGSALAAGEVK
eukprot:CAMPEP_0206492032 /NCGR_PEP_ID=MMETSP0324_2-20121206/45632_1 /ASSEMBLY_ACC=CAM_ASM_000836 /TAXON_ID=2866 /ORGANISM="Crypthecodinium cohnii, Strain Seligo" /LENGTH=557 /DNA_ID=CAMNT_0053973901 /DNA_START=66 /DNA_END=1739 /DNA_ORIENTATION=+